MSERRGTLTDRLANVIQVIQLGRKTGTLHVERGEGATREEGSITFVQGQITQAQGGQRTSQAALTWLSTWSTCHFTFVTDTLMKSTGPLTALPRTPQGSPSKDTQPMRVTSTTPAPAQANNALELPSYSPQGARVPYRTRDAEEAIALLNRAKFSRVHRNLLLLVDGRRTFAELVRLVGRKPEEVQKLLQDLQQIGVLQFHDPTAQK